MVERGAIHVATQRILQEIARSRAIMRSRGVRDRDRVKATRAGIRAPRIAKAKAEVDRGTASNAANPGILLAVVPLKAMNNTYVTFCHNYERPKQDKTWNCLFNF